MDQLPKIAISNRLRSTPFTSRVQKQGVKAFTVYNHMLLATEFESVEADYRHLCKHVQVWDVGAERQVEIKGPDAQKLVQWMTPRNIASVDIGRCLYVPLADEDGYLINDPVALKLSDNHWWLSLADSDVLLWAKGLATAAKLDVSVCEPDVWPLAVQGPKAEELMSKVFGEDVRDIRFFRFQPMRFKGREFNVARSGWSKQGGFEVYVDDADVGCKLWDALFEAGEDLNVRAGCPNIIERMESSLLSFGNDMTMRHTVLESGLDHFFDLHTDADSLSGDALRAQQAAGIDRKLMGMIVPAPSGPMHVAMDANSGFVKGDSGQLLGRLGSQVWSPKYQKQLLTVMLEKPFYGNHEDSPEIRVQCQNGAFAQASIVPLPFNLE